MSVRNLFDKPLHFEYSLGLFCLWKLLRLYALLRQLSLVGKELAGEKKVVTSLARKDDENYKKTLALLKPYLTSAAYHKTLEFSKDKLKHHFLFELLHLAFALLLLSNNLMPRLWHLSGKLYRHPCVYSHVFVYLALRLGVSYLFRLPFRYCYRFCLESKHGLKSKTRFAFFRGYFGCYVFFLLFLSLMGSGLTYLERNFRRDFFVNAMWFLAALCFSVVWVYPLFAYLFYPLGPLEDPELRKEVDAMGKKVGLSSDNVKVVPSSQVSDLVTLSWGFGKTKWLYLNESYLDLGKPSALALVAHALGHFKHHHFLKFFVLKSLKFFVLLFAFEHFKRDTSLFKSFGVHSVNSLVVKLDTFSVFLLPLYNLFFFLLNVFGNFTEFEADRYAVKLGLTDELVNFWTTLYKEKKWFFNLDPLYALLFKEKPSLFERVYSVFDATPRATAN